MFVSIDFRYSDDETTLFGSVVSYIYLIREVNESTKRNTFYNKLFDQVDAGIATTVHHSSAVVK